MGKRTRIAALVTTLCLCLSLFVVGVLAATSATFNVTSTLNFKADGVYVMVDASLKQGADVSSAAVLAEGAPTQPTFKAYSYPRMATGTTPDAPNGEPSTTHFVNESGAQANTWAIGDINYTSTNKVVVYEFTVSNYSPFEVQGTVSGISEALATYIEQGQLTIATYTGTSSSSATATGSPTYTFNIPARTNETTPGQTCYKIAVTLNDFMSNLATGEIEMNVSFTEKLPYRIEQENIGGVDYIFVYFGKYPQTYVGDTMNAELEAWYTDQPVAETYTAYKGYSGSTLNEPVAYNAYEYIDGNIYCRVPEADLLKNSGAKTFKDGTTIVDGETYWFKVEPIQWRVLTQNYTDAENSIPVSYLLSEYVLSSNITFNLSTNNINYAYYSAETNTLRPFLNEVFYSDAFTAEEKALIAQRTLTDADLDGTGTVGDLPSTEPLNVFAPTYYDMIEADYGFNTLPGKIDQQRRASATDFAMANLAYKSTSSYPDIHGLASSLYWTSSAVSLIAHAYRVNVNGLVNNGLVNDLINAVRPALLFNL